MYQQSHVSHQFPQPTRPMGCSSPVTNHQLMISSQGLFQFPNVPSSTHTFSNEERRTTSTSSEEEVVVDELVIILLECFEHVDMKDKELLLRKMFIELEKEEDLKRFIINRLEHSEVKVISELLEKHNENIENFRGTLTRELNVDPTASKDLDRPNEEELKHKLERFKVKTIKLGGVVK